MRCGTVLLGVHLVLASASATTLAQEPFTFTHPSAGSDGATFFNGVSGNRVVGSWLGDQGSRSGSFVYDLGTRTWQDFAYPGARYTDATGIAGNTVVGIYFGPERDLYRSFVYDLTTGVFTPLDHPRAAIFANRKETYVYATEDDGRIIGSLRDEGIAGGPGFIRDAAGSFTDVVYPGADETSPVDADGARIVGMFDRRYGFLYDGNIWSRLEHPGAERTGPAAIEGDRIVGSYSAGENELYGFIYDIPTGSWSPFEYPGAVQTSIRDIEGGVILGSYYDGTQTRAFVALIPEPSIIAPLILTSFALAAQRRRRG